MKSPQRFVPGPFVESLRAMQDHGGGVLVYWSKIHAIGVGKPPVLPLVYAVRPMSP
jgi:hypothetical protein